MNVTVTGAATAAAPPALNSTNTVLFSSLQVNGAGAFTISGIRVAMPTIKGNGALVNASVVGNQLNLPNQSLVLAVGAPTLLASVVNYGVPCLGSATPSSIDFSGLAGASTSSTIRVTEASLGAFAPKPAGSDFGVRFLVTLSGYGPNAQVYVPDVIVGGVAPTPTSSGAFNSSVSGGTFTPGSNQLLLTRVNGTDAAGGGGTLVLGSAPLVSTDFTSVTRLSLSNGAGSAVYEVLAANSSLVDSAQIPVFVVVPPSSCSTIARNTLGVTLAPASNVSTPTQTDPIPRYVAATPPSDCSVMRDCSAGYFPVLQVTPASVTLTGSSLGSTQTDFITVGNGGSSQLAFTVSSAYQTATGQSVANWLSISDTAGIVNPSAGINNFVIRLSANPATLIPGTYQATVTIDAGSLGAMTVPVTFNVGAAGPIIQSVVNAANSQTGPVAAGSFASIYGVNLVAKNKATVTFNGFPAAITYNGQPSASAPAQINVLVPPELGQAANAGVVATIDGVVSNTFPVKLVANAPAVFNPGILNENNSVNLASAPESRGHIIQIFLTGLATPISLPVTVNIGSASITGSQIIYAAAAPTIPGLEQVNVRVPSTLEFSGNSAPLSICVPVTGGSPACSAPVNLYLQP
jgi:uncharacterized protein (TIGR03437 family)